MPARRLALLLPLSLAAAAAPAQEPCPDFTVNPTTASLQSRPDIASDADGGFVVVWQSFHEGSEQGVFGQRHDAGGTRRGPEFQANTFTTAEQGYPRVGSDALGNFVVVWESNGQDGSGLGLFGRRFDAVGAPLGGEFAVNTYTTGDQRAPALAANASGSFVVVWSDLTQVAGQAGTFGRRYDADGNPQGAEFQVSNGSADPYHRPAVAVSPAGDFVVTWVSPSPLGESGDIVARRFSSSGAPLGPEFVVNTYTTGRQSMPDVAFHPGGQFVVAWVRGSGAYHVFGRRFDSAGMPAGPEFPVSDLPSPNVLPQVAFDDTGGFVVAWQQGLVMQGAFARRFAPAGVPEGPGFRVSTDRPGFEIEPAVATTPNRGFVVTWAGEYGDGSSGGTFASLDCARLYTVPPCRVADTREPTGPSGGPALSANSARAFPVAGLCGIPADARAVALNVTAVSPSDSGDLRLHPTGQTLPQASVLNFTAPVTRANNAVLPLGVDGRITVQCDMPLGSAGATHLVLDAYGYFKR